nr:DUF3427 domain-containing protein [Alloscardovia theropitheci]
MFCSCKKEAKELSELLNQRGLKTVALTGEDSQEYREQTVTNLENGAIDYILVVDIFNEGIDIPCINQVVMLRNTQSSIIFVQQLGRGLRKFHSKEYVTVIDFIGNYKNNYLIPIALFGDQSMNKDNYRRDVRQPFSLQGLTTINFEKIARDQIFKSISKAPYSSVKNLEEIFVSLKNRLGRIPYLYDFVINKSVEPLVFFENRAYFRSYADVINKFSDETERIVLSDVEKRYLEFVTFELAPGKRQQDLVLLELLVNNDGIISEQSWIDTLNSIGVSTDKEVLESVKRVLDLSFLKATERKRYGTVPLVQENEGKFYLNSDVMRSLSLNKNYAKLFNDIIAVGRSKQEIYPEVFTIGRKYTIRDVLKLLNFKSDEPIMTGYKIDRYSHSCPVFVTYKKNENINETIKYKDGFIDESTLGWESTVGRSLSSNDVRAITDSEASNLRLELYVKKDDNEGHEFYYLGRIHYVLGSAEEIVQEKTGKGLVHMLFDLDTPVEPSLYRYLTQE